MKQVPISRCLSLISVLFGVWGSAGCDEISTSKYTNVNDKLCNGQTFSFIASRETEVWARGRLPHSGRYGISQDKDSWLVTWSLEDEQEASVKKPDVKYLGQYKYERTNFGNKISKKGYTPGHFICLGDPQTVLLNEDTLKTLNAGVEKLSENNAQRIQSIMTRSRKHIYCWLPEPAIYSLPDMKLVKKINVTESFLKFKEHFKWRENRSQILTEDLSYLIAVPHSGASEENSRSGEHTKAFCYNTIQDEVSTISLTGLGKAQIFDAEVIKEELNWLVRKWLAEENQWLILDSDSHILNKLSISRSYSDIMHWSPAHDFIWFASFKRDGGIEHEAKLGMSVLRHNIKDGTQVKFELPAYDELVVPE